MSTHFIGSFDESILPNMEDFKKYYEGTFLLLNKSTDSSNIVYISAVDIGAGKIVLTNPILGSVILSSNTETELSSDFPEPGYFYNFTSNEKTPYLISWYSRKPARQWKKAPHSQNSIVFNCLNNTMSKYSKLDWRILSNIYRSKELYTNSWERTLEQIKIFNLPVIINKYTLLYPFPKENSYFLYFNNTPVAIYNPKEKKITEYDKNFIQEINDFFNRQGVKNVFK